MRGEAASTLDGLVLTAILGATVQSITNNGSAGIPALWADVGRASSLLTTHEGTRLPADTLLAPSSNVSWFTSQMDKETKPIFGPFPAGVDARAGTVDTPIEGFAGWTIGGADVYRDDNLKPTTTNATLVLGNFGRGVLVMCGPPVLDVFPEWHPDQLTALVRFKQYCAIAVLYGKAFCRISGSAYAKTPDFSGS